MLVFPASCGLSSAAMRGHFLLAVGLCACGASTRHDPGNVDASTAPDSQQGNGGGDGGDGTQVFVYAHTA